MTTGAVTIAHLSDLHIGQEHNEAIGSLSADVAAAGPDVVVVTGDLTMRARPGEFDLARQFLALLPPPTMVVLGNHDVPLFALHERLLDPYERYRRHLGRDPRLDPVVEVAGARILGLQSMPRWRWKSGRVSRRQLELVARVLGSAPPAAVRVLAMHHPPSLGGIAALARVGGLRRRLATAGVDLVLAGHTHVPRVERIQLSGSGSAGGDGDSGWGLVEVVCGTSGSTRTRGAPPAWMLIRADERQIAVTTRVFTHDVGWRAGPVTVCPRQPRRSPQ